MNARHSITLALIGAFAVLGLWREEGYFFIVAGAIAAGYGLSLWAWRKRK
ncbi:MAG: hypothetical protein WCZ23_05510 [Rhodospirillaceae bacterium]